MSHKKKIDTAIDSSNLRLPMITLRKNQFGAPAWLYRAMGEFARS